MKNVLDILDKDTLSLIEESKAKPDKTIKEHTLDLIERLESLKSLGYIDNDKTYELVEKACVYHDLGKLNEEFQKRVNSKSLKFDERKEISHNILSIYFVNRESFESEEDYIKVAHSVLNHHNYCNNFDEIGKRKELIEKLLGNFKTYRLNSNIKSKLSQVIESTEAIKVKGYLHKCDYSASSASIVEYPNDFLQNSLYDLLKKWKENNSEISWNELQNFCIENKDENIIAVAQTGMGKTEAGLLWIGNNKGFFILPIRTAINAIYDRVRKDILEDKNIDKRLAILHSSSLEYYIRNIRNDSKEKEEIDLINYHKVGKELSIPVSISTMDQLFGFVFKHPLYELNLTTLSYSKLVIDEIQAYSPELLAYLIYGLEKVVELGGKIAILTATLPPFIKDLLKKKISFKENPSAFTNNIKRHNLKIIPSRINADDIYNTYKLNKESHKHNKILVVCNTITEAQKIYEKLMEYESDIIGRGELNILHSKFIKKDRLEKEERIIEFGKTYVDKNSKVIDKQNGIWISTSIVEASLDIDFDYLFTELQELNSLFQRLGRCNRKGAKDSSGFNCFIYTEIDKKYLTSEKNGFIDARLFKLSKEAIESCRGLISEDEKIELIEKHLTTANLKGSDYMRKYKNIYNFIEEIPPYEFQLNEVNLRKILSQDIIPSPIYEVFGEDIREIENRLLNEEMSIIDKIKLQDKLKQYTVSVELYHIKNYDTAIKKGQAVRYRDVLLSKYKNNNIRVIECNYDEIGFKKMDYNKAIRNSNMV